MAKSAASRRRTESVDDGRPPEPPTGAPEVPRRVEIAPPQLVGLALLALVPLLALLNAFGTSRAEATAASSALELRVEYASRSRYKVFEPLDVFVRNRSQRTLDTVAVSLDTAYIDRFSEVQIEPQPTGVYVVPLTSVRPGETRRVAVELRGNEYGRHRGTIRAAAGADSATARVSTIVYP
jgi:hypothetical protein